MQVFKVYFKIIKNNLSEILIYLAVFLLLAILLTSLNTANQAEGFTQTKCKIAFINNDKNTALTEGLKNYLYKNSQIVDIKDDKKLLSDALFYREIEYIVKVPAGFCEAFKNGKEARLEIIKVPESISSVYMDNMINKYLNTAKLYLNNMNNISEEELISYIEQDLSEQANISLLNEKTAQSKNYLYYFNYSAYSIPAMLILGVCCVMMVFNKTDLKRRNLCSPVKSKNINIQLILGNLTFAFAAWFIVSAASIIIYKKDMFTVSGLLFLLNSLVFTLSVLSISFLISNIIKSRTAMSAAANVVALGSSFISGVFVPQSMLGEKVLNIASFTPTYWYIKTNNIVAGLTEFNMRYLSVVFRNIFIIFVFALAILAITLVIMKQRKTAA